MIIYNKTTQRNTSKGTSINTVNATRLQLTEENKLFLKLLKLKVTKNV